jgi:hypothetical protein
MRVQSQQISVRLWRPISNEISPELTLSDRDYFLVHKNNPLAGLFFSHPFRSRINDTKPTIALSRRINKPDGSFGGVAAFRPRVSAEAQDDRP